MTIANDNLTDRAESVARGVVNSLKRLQVAHDVPPEQVLEGVVKAAAVYALHALGDKSAVAEMFEAFAMTLRELPEEKSTH